jgi:hypothetical protein
MKAKLNSTEKRGTEANPIKMLMIKGSLFAMDLEPKKETEKALFINVMNTSCGSNKDMWIPKSVVTREGENYILPSWFISKLCI